MGVSVAEHTTDESAERDVRRFRSLVLIALAFRAFRWRRPRPRLRLIRGFGLGFGLGFGFGLALTLGEAPGDVLGRGERRAGRELAETIRVHRREEPVEPVVVRDIPVRLLRFLVCEVVEVVHPARNVPRAFDRAALRAQGRSGQSRELREHVLPALAARQEALHAQNHEPHLAHALERRPRDRDVR